MIKWITRPLALAIHDRQIAEHGGGAGIRDESLLESALARPQQLYAHADPSPDPATLAASLAFALVRNHPFVDGNKRTAHVCYRVFLAINQTEIMAGDDDKYIAMLSLAEGSIGEEKFAAWLRERLVSQRIGRVQEGRTSARVRGKSRR